jgi:lysophospholipase L1-like esterase
VNDPEDVAMNMFRRVGHRGRAGWLLLLIVGITAVWLLLQGNSQEDKAVYLALGDSTAKGTGYGVPETKGYVARFHAFLTSALGTDLTLLNLAEDGATSETLISHQLHAASQILQAKGMKVAMVTISVGGDDLFKLTEAADCAGGGAADTGVCRGDRSSSPGCAEQLPDLFQPDFGPAAGGRGRGTADHGHDLLQPA